MDEQKLLLNFASKIFNLGEDKVTDLIYDKTGEGDEKKLELKKDALKLLTSQDATRIDALKSADSGKFEEGYNKAKAEVMPKFEKNFKKETGFESDKQGMDLINEWGNSLKSTDNLTEEALKVTPAWLSATQKLNEANAGLVQAEKDRYTDLERTVKRDTVLSVVKSRANEIFDGINPILPKNSGIAANQKSLFLGQVTNGLDFKVEGDAVSGIIKDGKLLENEHGHTVKFDDFVTDKIKGLYEVPTGGGAGGNAGNENENSGGAGIIIPKNIEERNKMMSDAAGDDKKIKEIDEAYKASQGS